MTSETTRRPRATVKPFSRAMVKEFLEAEELVYLRDQDDDFMLQFKASGTTPELTVWLSAEGETESIYAIRGSGTAPTDLKVEECYRLCNEWNARSRWPKAFVLEDPDEGLVFNLEGQLNLSSGVHQALFQDFTMRTLAATFQFFHWLDERKSDGETDGTAAPGAREEVSQSSA